MPLMLPQLSIDAFTNSEEGHALLRSIMQNPRASDATVSQFVGGVRQAIERYSQVSSPALILIEVGGQSDELFVDLERLALRCEPGTCLVLIGPANDIRLYQRLIQMGVSEYVALPSDQEEVLQVLSRVLGANSNGQSGRVVSVVGATGGCGSSTMARILAQFLGEHVGSASIVVDLDASFGSAGFAFGFEADEEYARGLQTPGRMDKFLLERLLKNSHPHCRVLMTPGLTFSKEIVIDLDRIIAASRQCAAFTCLDVPHSGMQQIERVVSASDEIVLVAPPTLLGLRNAKMMLARLPREPRVVLNQMHMKGREEISLARFGETLGVVPIAAIKFDARLFTLAESEGCPVFKSSRDREARPLRVLIEKIAPQSTKIERKNFSLFRFLRRA